MERLTRGHQSKERVVYKWVRYASRCFNKKKYTRMRHSCCIRSCVFKTFVMRFSINFHISMYVTHRGCSSHLEGPKRPMKPSSLRSTILPIWEAKIGHRLLEESCITPAMESVQCLPLTGATCFYQNRESLFIHCRNPMSSEALFLRYDGGVRKSQQQYKKTIGTQIVGKVIDTLNKYVK